MFNVIEVVISGSALGLDRTLESSTAKILGFSRTAGAANDSLLLTSTKVAAGLGVVALGAAVVVSHMASKFQSDMLLIQTQARAGTDEVKRMSTAMIDLAPQVGFGPDALATALYHVESVGLRGAAALDAVKIAAEGAKVGHADLEQTTNSLTSAIASGIGGVQNMEQAMGALNAIVGAGDMKMTDLNSAMSSGILSVAKNYGLSLTDVGAALATFGDLNIRGANAATQLRMSVMSLAQQGAPGKAALAGIGIQANQLAHDMQTGGLNKAVTDLRQHLLDAGITGSRTGEFLLTAFTKRAGVGLGVLLDQYDRFQQKQVQVRDGAAQFADAWKATSETVTFRLSAMRSGAEALAVSFGLKLLPIINDMITRAYELGGSLKDGIATIIRDMEPTWVALVSIMHDAWVIFGDLYTVIAPIVRILGELALGVVVDSLNLLLTGIAALMDYIAAHQGIVLGLAVALGITLAGGVGAVAAAIGTGLLVMLDLGMISLGGITAAVTVAGAAMSGFALEAATIFGTFGLSLAGLSAALTALAASTVVATAGFSLAIVAVAEIWQGYGAGVKAGEDALKSFNKVSVTGSLTQQIDGVTTLDGKLADMQQRLTDIGNRSTIGGIVDLKGSVESLRLPGEMDKVSAASETANKNLSVMIGTLSTYGEQQLKASNATRQQAAEFYTGVHSGEIWTSVLKDAGAAGVKLGDTAEVISQKMTAYNDAQKKAQQGSVGLAAGFKALGTPMELSKEETQALADELKGLAKGLDSFSSPLATYKQILSDKNQAERDAAQKTADSTKNTKDSWKDYVKSASVSLDEFSKTLEKQTKDAQDWQVNLIKVAGRAGADVASALAKMGKDGVELTAQMANGTDAQTQRAAKALMDNMQIGSQGAANNLNTGMKLAEQYATDGGHTTAANLALQLNIGVADVEQIAKQYGFKLAAGINPVLSALGVAQVAILAQEAAPGFTGTVKRAAGGPVHGPGGPRDDKIPAWLSNGEFVVNAASTSRHRHLLEELNAERFASGGFVSTQDIPRPPSLAPKGPPIRTAGDKTNQLAYDTVTAALTTILATQAAGQVGGSPIGGWDGRPNTIALIEALAAGLGSRLTVTSTFRPGGGSYHARGQAVDFSDGTDTAAEMALDRAWATKYGASTAELIHAGGINIKDGRNVGDGMALYTPGVMAQHHNHVHIALSPESILRGKQIGPVGAAPGAAGPNVSASNAGNAALGQQMAAARGWTGMQWDALRSMWQNESGWNNMARNPSSGAFGIPQCLGITAQILTRRGWLAHDEVQVGDETIGYNPATGTSEWTPITAVHHPGVADVQQFGNYRWSVRCTPNHRWLMERLISDKPVGAEMVELRSHKGRRHRVVLARPAVTESSLPISVREAALLGWIAGDGWQIKADPKQKRRPMTYGGCQVRGKRWDYFEALLQGDPNMRVDRERDGVREWRVHAPFSRDLTERAGGNPKVFAVEQVLAMSTEQRSAWLEAIMNCDGYFGGSYTQISQKAGPIAEAIKLAVYLSGNLPSAYKDDRAPNVVLTIGVTDPHIGMRTAYVQDAGREEVWCVSTDLGTWTAMQDGVPFLTGNSLPASKMGSAGAAGDPRAQIAWGLDYIAQVYGTPVGAYSRWTSRSPHWYADGGLARMHDGGMVGGWPTGGNGGLGQDERAVALQTGERVLSRQAVREHDRASGGLTRQDLQALITAIARSGPAVGALTVNHNSAQASASDIVDAAFHASRVARLGGRR